MATFTQIGTAQVVGSGGSGTISFTSIPQTYTDLVLVLSARTNGTTGPGGIARVYMQANSITTGYNNYLLYNITTDAPIGANGVTEGFSFFYAAAPTATTSTFGMARIYINNYSSGTLAKPASIDGGVESIPAASGIRAMNAGYQSNTAAITSLTIYPADAVVFVQYSSAYLYGVSNV